MADAFNITGSDFGDMSSLFGQPQSQQMQQYIYECWCMNNGIQSLAYILLGAGILAVCLAFAFWILEDIFRRRDAQQIAKKVEEVVK